MPSSSSSSLLLSILVECSHREHGFSPWELIRLIGLRCNQSWICGDMVGAGIYDFTTPNDRFLAGVEEGPEAWYAA